MSNLDKLRWLVEAEENELQRLAAVENLSICLADVVMTPTPALVLFHRTLGHYIDALIALEAAEQAEYRRQKL